MAYTKTIWINGEVALSDTNMNNIEKGIEDAHNDISDLKSTGSDFLLALYPVGSILFNANGVNPSTYIGGTWVAWGSGRVPVGVNTDDTDFNTAEKTGGRKDTFLPSHKHTFAGSALPAHNHGLMVKKITTDTRNVPSDLGQTSVVRQVSETLDSPAVSAGTPSGTISYEGVNDSTAAANLQPYITCYMWKRTA